MDLFWFFMGLLAGVAGLYIIFVIAIFTTFYK